MPGIIIMDRRRYSSGVTPLADTEIAMPGNFVEQLTLTESSLIFGEIRDASWPVMTLLGAACAAGHRLTEFLHCWDNTCDMRMDERHAEACDFRPARMILPVPNIKNLPSFIVRIRMCACFPLVRSRFAAAKGPLVLMFDGGWVRYKLERRCRPYTGRISDMW